MKERICNIQQLIDLLREVLNSTDIKLSLYSLLDQYNFEEGQLEFDYEIIAEFGYLFSYLNSYAPNLSNQELANKITIIILAMEHQEGKFAILHTLYYDSLQEIKDKLNRGLVLRDVFLNQVSKLTGLEIEQVECFMEFNNNINTT